MKPHYLRYIKVNRSNFNLYYHEKFCYVLSDANDVVFMF